MDGFITITDKVVKFVVNTGTGKKTKWTKFRSLVKLLKYTV